jgi:hypothetical protein
MDYVLGAQACLGACLPVNVSCLYLEVDIVLVSQPYYICWRAGLLHGSFSWGHTYPMPVS